MSELTTRSHDDAAPQLAIKQAANGSVPIVLVGTALVTIAGFAELFCVAAIAAIMMVLLLVVNERPRGKLRALRDRIGRYGAHAERERNRRRQLRRADLVVSGAYNQIRMRVDRALCSRCPIVERLDLEQLLDHYVRLAVTREQYTSALPAEGAWTLVSSRELPTGDHCSLRDKIAARRTEHRDVCRRRVAELSEELDAIDELVGLVEQRIACPETDPDSEQEIEWRLSHLDEMDAALQELSGRPEPDPSAAARASEARCSRQ